MDEGAGQFLKLPRSRRFAGTQPYHHVLDPHRLPRPERQVPDDTVALVQQSDHRDPLRHRRNARLVRRGPRHIDGNRLVARRFALLCAIAPRHEQRQRDRKGEPVPRHAYSGFHAS